ncbi:biogenesis of lysosome-related organelles complex 1 subunit 4-like [Lytechinus variegatus]|uniref:biogenesis of lysosome-related organelles complex 1 subunit 4-like n=1 Tax=Lytechinus variegatus TaxID=7654 RepID=UPI001BB16610|nr:biogenesis of lysosome-related organelles complex 1 subunit 4-like [Lytechinus variegatus]
MAEVTASSEGLLSVEECVRPAASEYASYFEIEQKKQSQQLEEEIEEMLTKLDEFCAVVDMVRTDSSLALNRSLPEIQTKAKNLEKIFTRIDQLEEFVSIVRKNVDAYEELVNMAEKDLGTLNSIKSLFSSLPLFSKKITATKQKKFAAPEVFSTSDYITKPTGSIRQTEEDS